MNIPGMQTGKEGKYVNWLLIGLLANPVAKEGLSLSLYMYLIYAFKSRGKVKNSILEENKHLRTIFKTF